MSTTFRTTIGLGHDEDAGRQYKTHPAIDLTTLTPIQPNYLSLSDGYKYLEERKTTFAPGTFSFHFLMPLLFITYSSVFTTLLAGAKHSETIQLILSFYPR
jgi:hypothetical protein